jgi:uncharacterized membrane protein YphA (DoxX/SURF4 family)
MLFTVLATISTLLLSYLFVVGGWQKLADTAYFRDVITEYRIVPASWSPAVARALPIVEISVGLALLIPALQLPALGAVAVMLAGYTFAMALNITRGRRDLDCGCAGPGQEQTISGWLLGRNLALISLALLSGSALQQHSLGWSGWSLALLGTAVLALLYHTFNQLIANNNLLRRIARHG